MASVAVVRTIKYGVEEQGFDATALLDLAGIDAAQLDDVDLWLPLDLVLALWDHAAELTADPAFGLHTAELIHPGTLDVFDYALFASPTIGDALRRVAKTYGLLSGGTRVDYDLKESYVTITRRSVTPDVRMSRNATEFALARALVYVRRGTDTPAWPREVTFQHAAPVDTSEHSRLFGEDVKFDQPESSISFDRDVLDLPLVEADSQLCSILDRHAADLLVRAPSLQSTSDQVRRQLAEAIRGTTPGVEETAQALGMGHRTLQRRLRAEQTTYQDLVEDVRRDLATRYLNEGAMSIGEIAFILGFSQPSAFYRAFRRWMGTTPAEYRRSSIGAGRQ